MLNFRVSSPSFFKFPVFRIGCGNKMNIVVRDGLGGLCFNGSAYSAAARH